MPITTNMNGVDTKIATMLRGDGFKRGLAASALYLRGKLGTYPAVSRRPVAQFLTPRALRFLHAASRSGDIDIPYRRGVSPGSQRMGLRWEVKPQSGGLMQVIGNNTGYINYVQGDEQSIYHRETGWEKIEDIVDDERDNVFNIINSEVAKDVR